MSEITFQIVQILLPAVLVLVGAALTYATTYLRAKTAAIEHERIRATVNDTLTWAHVEVYDAVRAAAQTFVDDLKAKNEDGVLTPEEVKQAKEVAWNHFKAQMGEAGLEELQRIVGDVAGWFASEVEAAVRDLGKDS